MNFATAGSIPSKIDAQALQDWVRSLLSKHGHEFARQRS